MASANLETSTPPAPTTAKLKVLVIAPFYDKNIPGESFVAYRWAEGICKRTEATVLTSHVEGWKSEDSPLPASEILNWTHFRLKGRFARLARELKPQYFSFYRKARKWIKKKLKEGTKFDLIHQVNPIGMRYPCPGAGLGIKYIVGPFGGGLATPSGFKNENTDGQWFRKLRGLDQFRWRRDPWLRRSYENAEIFIGIGPYVRDLLRDISLKRFEVICEVGTDVLKTPDRPDASDGRAIKLLYVGRIIRTKGVIDAIRATAVASRSCKVELDVVGDGDHFQACKNEATRLGIDEIVRFHGRQSKDKVYEFYGQADIFLFPSFREPTGGVILEAMGCGLPVICSDLGGPAYIVDDSCGLRVATVNPVQYSEALAEAIVKLTNDSPLRASMATAAIERMKAIASWEGKFDTVINLYNSVL